MHNRRTRLVVVDTWTLLVAKGDYSTPVSVRSWGGGNGQPTAEPGSELVLTDGVKG